MTPEPCRAQKLVDDLVKTCPDIESVVLIDLHHGIAKASSVRGKIMLAAPELVAQFIQLYSSYQTLDLLIDNGTATWQATISRDPPDDDSSDDSPHFLIWCWEETRRWLMVTQTDPLSVWQQVTLLEIGKMLEECTKQLINEE